MGHYLDIFIDRVLRNDVGEGSKFSENLGGRRSLSILHKKAALGEPLF
jgi:hypothetical protein